MDLGILAVEHNWPHCKRGLDQEWDDRAYARPDNAESGGLMLLRNGQTLGTGPLLSIR